MPTSWASTRLATGDAAGITFDLRLTPQSARLFLLLHDVSPGWVTVSEIERVLLGGAASAAAVRTLIMRLRRQLAGSSFSVESRGGNWRHYRLVDQVREASA